MKTDRKCYCNFRKRKTDQDLFLIELIKLKDRQVTYTFFLKGYKGFTENKKNECIKI